MPHAALWVVQQRTKMYVLEGVIKFQCRTRLCGWCSERQMKDAPQRCRFNAARGFVGGAAMNGFTNPSNVSEFQCRTRLCGWCSRS